VADNVVRLTGGAVMQGIPNARCIEALRDLLERAEAGEVVGIACAVMHGDALASYRVCGTVGGYSMLGAAECVKAHLVAINLED
jgi:hypothetical protein